MVGLPPFIWSNSTLASAIIPDDEILSPEEREGLPFFKALRATSTILPGSFGLGFSQHSFKLFGNMLAICGRRNHLPIFSVSEILAIPTWGPGPFLKI